MVIKNSIILFSASLVGHILSYLYHLVAAKFLLPVDFGLLQSFIALNYITAALISSYSLSVIWFINTSNQPLSKAISALNRLSIKLTIVLWLVFIILYPAVQSLLHLDNFLIYVVFSIQLLFAFFPTVYSSAILAKLKFYNFSLLGLIFPALKLSFALVFLYLNFKIFGAIAALTLATVFGAAASIVWVNKRYKIKLEAYRGVLSFKFYSFFRWTILAQLSLTLLISIDIILARYFFPQSVGYYSAASLIARVVFFVSASVVTVAFPLFTSDEKNQKKHFLHAFLLIISIGMSGFIFYSVFPKFIISLFATPDYFPSAALLAPFGIFMALYSLFNLTVQLILNIRLKQAAIVACFSAFVQIALIALNHATFQAFILNSIIAVGSGLFIGLFIVFKHWYRIKRY